MSQQSRTRICTKQGCQKPTRDFDYIPPANEYDGFLKACVGILEGEGMKLAASHFVAACGTRCRIARRCPPPKTHGTLQEFMSICE